jgi:phosphatidylglycerol lysyltransferase
MVASFARIPAAHLLLAVLLTALNYVVLMGYDLLATRYIGRPLALGRVAFTSFLGYVSSFNFGALLGGTTVRYRLYSSWGLSSVEVAKVIAVLSLSSLVGLAGFAGIVFVINPLPIPDRLHLPFTTALPLGFLLLGVVGLYVAVGFVQRKPIRLGGWQVVLPPPRVAACQIAIGSADLAVAAAVLYVLLPATAAVGYLPFLGVFLLAIIVAVFSNVPGGLGVFELVVLVLMGPPDPHLVLASLLAFRVIYYLLPLGVAGTLLAGHEILLHRQSVGRIAAVFGSVAPALVPRVLGFLTFLAGVLLLLSGATPTVHQRLGWIRHLLPLPVMEISHFLGSVVGAGLLLLARGLQRRLDSAYWLTMAMLIAGSVFCLLKGADYEEAAILLAMTLLFAPARRRFYRKGSLLEQPLGPAWLAAAGVVLACSVWIGTFAYKHVDYSHELWWQFSFHGDAPRFLRATAGGATLLLVAAAASLLRPARPRPQLPAAEDLAAAAQLVVRSTASCANLALVGDKHLLFNGDRSAFIMYAVAGRSWVALGDPVGGTEARSDLIWTFRELCDRYAGRTVFYQVGEETLPFYLDLGLSLMKLGEEARVPLADFSLEGSARKQLRQTWNRFQREGCSFKILPAAEVTGRMDELERVSDAWLAEKSAAEKRFSLGSFQPDYVARFPVAIVHRAEQILGFSNLWLGDGKGELSVDLMRYVEQAPSGVMEYLFTELMLWGRKEGYQWFNLGMAPLSGLESRSLAPLWSRFGDMVFRHGEHFYGFQGLRQYKEKFHPHWRPKYLASPGGFALPRVLADIAMLISGGSKGLLVKTE